MASNGSETLSSLLKKVAYRHGLERRIARGKVWEIWQSAVGEAIARHAWPRGFREGSRLVVAVADAVWMQQLSLQKALLLEVLNRHLPDDAKLEDIRFVQADVEKLRRQWIKGAKKSRRRRLPPVKVSQEVREKAELLVASIKDEELKSGLLNLYLRSHSRTGCSHD